MQRRTVVAAGVSVLVALVVLSGCAGGGDGAARSPAPTSSDPPTAAPPVLPADVLTDELLLEQVEWLLALLEPGASGPPATESQQRFGEAFLAQVDPLQLGAVFAQVRAGGPYEVVRVAPDDVGRSAVLALDAAEPLLMTVAVGDDGRIEGLLFRPDTTGEVPSLSSWADLDAALAELGGEVSVVVVDGADGALLHASPGTGGGTAAWPSGSVYKLLVLSAVVDAVEVGDLGWDDELTVTDEVRSLPSGVLQDRPDGFTVTVAEAAELMISVSDNTATDLLTAAVGQPAVAGTVERLGLPEDLLPLTTTRQLFQLGWQAGQEVREAWARADSPQERSALLAALPDDLDVDPLAVTEPRWDDGVDWMLSGRQVAELHLRLQEQAGTEAGEPVRGILAKNPGVAVPEGVTYQAFKGGSAPGVLALSFLLESQAHPEGAVLVVQVRSEVPVEELRAATVVEGGLRHLAGGGDR